MKQVIGKIEGLCQTFFDGKNIWMEYKNGEVVKILNNIPKGRISRLNKLAQIEEKARNNNYRCKADIVEQCENFHSLRNRYERQWTAMVWLIHGGRYGFAEEAIGYNYGDVIC